MAGAVAWELGGTSRSDTEETRSEPFRFDIQRARDSFKALLISAFVLLNFSLFLGLASIPVFSAVREDLFFAAGVLFTILSLCAVGVAATPLVMRVKGQLSEKRVTFETLILANLLFITVLSVHWLVNDAEQFAQNLTIEYLITGSTLLFFIQHVRSLIWRRAEWSLWTPLVSDMDTVSLVETNTVGEEVEYLEGQSVAVTSVEVGAVVRFEKGDIVPLDCTIIDGQALVLERELTFRGVEYQKLAGDELYAGSRVLEGTLTARVEALVDESRITTFYPKFGPEIATSYSSGIVVWFLALTAFVGIFFTLFWYKQEMLTDMIEPVLGSFLILTLFVEWFAFRRIAPRMQQLALYRSGVILKKRGLLARLERLDRLLLRNEADDSAGRLHVDAIELFDDRLDRAGLLSVLFAVFSKVQAPGSAACREYIEQELKDGLSAVSYSDLLYYDGMGIAVQVSGADFSIGTEGFLVERGVHLSSSEIVTDSSNVQYVALNDALVAVIKFDNNGVDLLNAAREADVRLLLAGEDTQDSLDAAGKNLGLDLAQVFGGESLPESIQRLEQGSSAGILVADASDARVVPSSVLSFAPFNRLLFDGSVSDVTLVDTPVAELLRAIRKVKLIEYVASRVDIFIPVATAVTAVPIALALVPAEILLAVVAANVGLLYLVLLRYLPLLK